MNYYIVAISEGRELCGTDNQRLVNNCKSMVKLNNALKWFKPSKQHDQVTI